MSVIGAMVERGDLWGASARIGSSYRFDKPAGLAALRSFSVLVLRRGLYESDPYERCYAISALAAAGDHDEIARLVEIFEGTRKPALRMAVADGLGDVGDADAVEALGQLYLSTAPAYRRIVVDGAAEAHDPGASELLGRALEGPDRTTRIAAARGLGQLGNRAAIPVLRRFAAAARDSFERAGAAYALLRLGDGSAVQIAEPILSGRVDDDARAMAAVALGRAGDPRVAGLLREALSDRNIDVRIGAAAALTHYGDPAGAAYLKAAIQDDDSITRLHVAQLLDEVEFRNARDVVIAAVASPDSELSLMGIRAVGLSGGAAEVGLLVRTADETEDPMARAEVAWALGRIGGDRSVVPLIAMVAELDHTVRYTAADALDRTAMRLLEGKSSGGA
ncbi:MAG TPA: HEAT repeat domain-containing protein [Candidatus Binataceae bacterium]|nr:HEAT repeat domain-containing protein [Candidatus Binataceae bacterium]